MTDKERLLSTKTYEEYEKLKGQLQEIDWRSKEVTDHVIHLIKQAGVVLNTGDDNKHVDYF